MEKRIENNLIDFYLSFAGAHPQIHAVRNEVFSYVQTSAFPWPNYVVGVDTGSDKTLPLLEKINYEIEENALPPFIICKNTDKNPLVANTFSKYKFRPVLRWTGMGGTKDHLLIYPTSFCNCRIKQVDNEDDLEQWIEVVNRALFNQNKLNVMVFSNLLNKTEYDIIMAYIKDEPCGTALTYRNTDAVGIYLVAVSEQFRKQGIGSAITQYIIEKNKYVPLVLHATKAGKRVYDKFNFKEYCTFDVYWKMGKFV
jgi:GNAT superfamily N-acetyltransferase